MSDAKWRCPPEKTLPASEWVDAQDKPPIQEYRKLSRPVFEWFDIEEVDFSVLDDEREAELKARGLHPKCRYRTKSIRAIAGNLEDDEFLWEFWCSDDGITTATLSLGRPPTIGFETRFAGPKMLVSFDEKRKGRPFAEYLPHGGDLAAGYDAHRARVRELVEGDGEVALSMDREADRDAFWLYYADYLVGKDIAEEIKTHRGEIPAKVKFGCAAVSTGTAVVLLGALALIGVNVRALWDWFIVWWPIVFVVSSPRALSSWAVTLFKGHMNHLDHKYPDAFEEHAGYWLKERIRTEGLEGKVEVGKAKESFLSDLDAYLPFRKKIVLGHKTYDKQDPTFWAIAAHELGHAIDFDRRSFLAPLSMVSRMLFSRFIGWVYAGLLVNTLFGWPVANNAIFWLLVSTLVAGAVVLVDEAIASIIAMRLLRSDDRINDEMARDMRRHLACAFATYFSMFIAHAALLAGWGPISEYILTHATFEPAEPLIPGRTGVANVLSLLLGALLAVAAGRSIAKMLRRGEPEEPEEPRADADDLDLNKLGIGCVALVVYLCLSAAFILEVWDQPLGERFRAAVFLFSPMVVFLFAPVTVPVALLLDSPTWIAKMLGFVPEAPEETPASRAAHAANDIVSEIEVLDPRQQLPWYVSATNPGPLLYALPLLVLWWLAQL